MFHKQENTLRMSFKKSVERIPLEPGKEHGECLTVLNVGEHSIALNFRDCVHFQQGRHRICIIWPGSARKLTWNVLKRKWVCLE